ncbi:hypothetical protein [Nonlabens ponticola]|uniref:Uncharacterized protein n=1 Tax=Nonlabens ponticola TaxID=2496866 RepID=A0A3S9MZ06_9FLAO|nr:hypothetical protein [Nonlabens ponticola]AZQ44491.1 hypothetical protein EJ995_09640 [Nonlabens ponticola]
MKTIVLLFILCSACAINAQSFHTEHNYKSKGIIIQNSYPKGGQRFTAPDGKEYVYVIFWTSITNSSDASMQLNLAFSANSFTIPSSGDINFNVYLPDTEMKPEKAALPNYGLDIISYLNKNLDSKTKLGATITPHSSYSFYTVAIANQGVEGTMRAGFELQNEELIYGLNNHKISSGTIQLVK